MKERTLQILSALIKDFVETGNPVASQKLLLLSKEFDISSATVRNEFSLLEEVGLIKSPHVSAGKVPTQKGYRFFVDELLENTKEEELVQAIFEKHIAEYRLSKSKEVLFDIVRLLSQLSGNVAFATVDTDRTFYLGLSNVLRSPEFAMQPEKAAQIVEILEGKERFRTMLESLDLEGKIKIFIGEENLLEEITSCAMVVARFETPGMSGTIGLLGPMRMKYGFNKALLKNALQMMR
jgi:heat-inducible transcriptional repressor